MTTNIENNENTIEKIALSYNIDLKNLNLKTVDEVRNIFVKAEINELPLLLDIYIKDVRSSVQLIYKQYFKKLNNYHDELIRIEKMKYFEKKYCDYKYICGIDEVGRGPLAGPVVAAAVILPKDCNILYINDSKKLSAKKREELYDQIIEKAVSFAVAIISPKRIDEINILQATYEAMRDAVNKLTVTPDILLNDAVIIKDINIKQVGIIKGDEKSISIAAASILAKVTRDRIMLAYDNVFPGYNFASNKGYGSNEHLEGIKKIGPSLIHRKTFITKYL
ncbi:MAG TPA: ribonuclease HII [Clostridiales bacterium]|nr:ribonuclease HII [Clostridiales bacterium]